MAHRQPLLFLMAGLFLLTAHAWLLGATFWLMGRWTSIPTADRILIGVVALEVAFPYLVVSMT
jgi:hypothetical protein